MDGPPSSDRACQSQVGIAQMIIHPTARTTFRRRLLAWYDREKREMPWRRTRNPYHIMLSEFMLQQTQVQTVIPYFERFVTDFPTVTDLARAELDDILKRWEGLGYYTRARNLYKAAVTIANDFGGQVPKTRDQLLSLPGFGPYTAAAVASIAFQEPHAVLDGNVIRVLARLGAVEEVTALPETKRTLQRAAEDLLNRSRPGDHNQAMMELGATVCKPRRPRCEDCCVRIHCLGYARGNVETIPRKAKTKPRPERVYGTVIVRRDDRYLISRRKPQGLLGGLWEFPGIETTDGDRPEIVEELIMRTFGIGIENLRGFRKVAHVYTHFSALVHAYVSCWTTGEPDSEEHDRHQWVGLGDLQDFAYSRIARKLVDALISRSMVGGQISIDQENPEDRT